MSTPDPIQQSRSITGPSAAAAAGCHAGNEEGPDQFDPASLRVDGRMSDAALGVERPLLEVPVRKPSKQSFFRVHPDPAMRMDAAVIELDAERETYLVTPQIAQLIPEETKLVRLLVCLPRTGGPFLWPLRLPEDGREMRWHSSARKAAEIAETKWVRMQANMALGAYDVTTSSHIPDPVWPEHDLGQFLRIAFGDGIASTMPTTLDDWSPPWRARQLPFEEVSAMTHDLGGKVVLVTGGSSGIGAAIARRLARAGAKVTISYSRNAEGADRLVNALTAESSTIAVRQADHYDPEAAAACIDSVVRQEGRLDILINTPPSGNPHSFRMSRQQRRNASSGST